MIFLCGENINIDEPTAIVAGNFDGIHLGHVKLIDSIKKMAYEQGIKTAVVSLSPHPAIFFNKKPRFERINTMEEKKRLIKRQGIDFYVELTFDDNFVKLSPREFIEGILIKKLKCAAFAIGEEYRFGNNREGDAESAKQIFLEFGVRTTIVTTEKCIVTGEKISSSMIRGLIEGGKINEANKLLGYNYLTLKRSHNTEFGL